LVSFLRFVGVPADNVTAVAHLKQRYRLPPPPTSNAANPLDPQLRAELDEFFAPFSVQLRKQLAMHRKCFAERTEKKRKARSGLSGSTSTTHAFARVG